MGVPRKKKTKNNPPPRSAFLYHLQIYNNPNQSIHSFQFLSVSFTDMVPILPSEVKFTSY